MKEDLQTTRLILRKIDQRILDDLFRNESEDKQLTHLGFENLKDLQSLWERYEQGLSTFNRRFLYFHLIRKDTGKSIGWCGFHTWYIDHKRAELGYVLDLEKNMNQGFMKEALAPIIKYGFEVMKLNRIEAFLAKTNTPSLKLLQHHGFVEEGLMRQHYLKNGRIEDSSIYSLLLSEYKLKNGRTN